MKSDFINKANETYINLIEVENKYEIEYKVINYVKCYLLQNKELESFNIDGIDVDVSKDDDDYYILFNDQILYISTLDGEIIDYKFR